MEELEITISDAGEVSIEAKGFVGEACEAVTKDLEGALGSVVDRRRKSEYYQQASQDQRLYQGG